ncbi:hypothetical protein M5689_002494 [Euphorbia peplus]|nr:hypothetical protein M5689_002494 [Euphorbia peplus]
MSWGLGWERPSKIYRLTLKYDTEELEGYLNRTSTSSSASFSSSSPLSPTSPVIDQDIRFRVDSNWMAVDDED